jgi:pimeloyl-ACP methyl ester carboxylesterase
MNGVYGERITIQIRGDVDNDDATVVWNIHGSPGSSDGAMSKLLYPTLFHKHVKLVTMNRDGYWYSDPLSPDVYPDGRVAGVAGTMQQVAETLNLPLEYFMGLSGGSRYALACGALIPRVKAVALMGSLAPMPLLGSDRWYEGMESSNRRQGYRPSPFVQPPPLPWN